MNCPVCETKMTDGWLAMWNAILGQKVRWQRTEPGYGRLRVPEDAVVVLRARFGGRGSRVASRCESCGTLVVPPEASPT
jgi:hypothetical protein